MCKAKCRLHNKLKRVERGKIMLVAKKEAVKIDVANKKPLIRKNQSTGEMVAGFLDPESGVFEVAMEITDERDIDEFQNVIVTRYWEYRSCNEMISGAIKSL